MDFWIGDWDVFDAEGGTKTAQVRIDKSLDGCALVENYEDSTGLRGQSLSIYDESRKVWHQSWVTNHGQLLLLEGQMRGGEMTLNGKYRASTGDETLVRGSWKPVEEGVRETAAKSTDNGTTWKPWFNLLFRPRQDDQALREEDSKIVAALDTKYQAAVKANDDVTMDRLLANDFLLVTGNGRKVTKSDLLAEARSRSVIYEKQDELLQFVHVWGDTAVVTAKLWVKGTDSGKPIDYKLWFSDTYVRTPSGWKYVLGQASRPLDPEP